MRLGFGYFATELYEGEELSLCGVTIQNKKNIKKLKKIDLMAYSIADALIGAAGLGDVQDHYDTIEKSINDLNSLIFLREVEKILNFEKFKITNIDITLSLSVLNIRDYKSSLIANISKYLFINKNQINLKIPPKDLVPNGKAICHTIVLLNRK